MKINTIPIIHPYNNTAYSRFWNGYFNYSGREWVVMHSKDKEIQAVEIHDPRSHSRSALKILLLFTVIVPLIAAIYHIIKVCHFRKYHVTLVTPQEKPKVHEVAQMQIREPKEEIATVTVYPQPPPQLYVGQLKELHVEQAQLIPAQEHNKLEEVAPLNAQEAYGYIITQDVTINKENIHLLQNLEKIPFKEKYQKYRRDLFKKLKELEVDYEDIREESLPLLLRMRGAPLRFTFKGSFKNDNATTNLLLKHLEELVSLFRPQPSALLELLRASCHLMDGQRLYDLLLTKENLSRMTAEELGDLFDLYGTYVDKINNEYIQKKYTLKLLDRIPLNDLFPFIFKAKSEAKKLLNLLVQKNNLEYTCQVIQTTLTKSPDLIDEMFHKFQNLKQTNKAYALVLVAYISAGKIYQNPDQFLRLMLSFPESDVLHQILGLKEGEYVSFEKSFVDNLKALVLHKEVKEEIRLQFFEEFSIESVTAKFILEFASDEENLKKLKENCEKKWADPLFNVGMWKALKRECRAYILLIRCLNNLKEKTADFTSLLLKTRPEVFVIEETKLWSFYPLLLAIETLNNLENIKSPDPSYQQNWAKELALITPLKNLKLLTQLLLKITPQVSAQAIGTFVTYVLNRRDENAIKIVLKEVLPKLIDYFHHEFSALKELLHAFDTPNKLEYALDCLHDLPSKPKLGLLSLFSEGIVIYEDQKEVKLQINLPEETIKEVYKRKGVEVPLWSKLHIMEFLSML